MTTDELQEIADEIEGHLNKARRKLREVEKWTCGMADKGDALSATANPFISRALGYVALAKGEATEAGNLIPGIKPKFGGK